MCLKIDDIVGVRLIQAKIISNEILSTLLYS
jgi:hypothetical protein